MSKSWKIVIPMLLLMVGASSGLAGGRARVVSVKAPETVQTGQAFDVTFEVRHEMGRRRDIAPRLVATLDDTEVHFATARKGNGYGAHISLPKAGRWQIRVSSQYCETVMEPVSIVARTAS